ncbi:MAG: S1 family peptidase [Angustibacter sp.]
MKTSVRIHRCVVPVAVVAAVTLVPGLAQAQSSRPDQTEQQKVASQTVGLATAAGSGRSGSLADEAAARRRAPADSSKVPGRVVDRVAGDDLRSSKRFTRSSLGQLKQQLEGAAGHHGESFGFYYDARRDAVVLEGDVARTRLPRAALASGQLVVKYTADARRVGRYNDTTPFWGGAAVYNGGVRCSSGFTVQNSSGARSMVTAGHCGNVGSVWRTGAGLYFGTMTSKASFPTWDLALLSGSSYGTYIYMGGRTGFGTPTGAAGNPVVGFSYCASGSTTYENCGKVATSLNGSFCDAAGCTPGLATFTGGSAVGPGDSGGPVVFKSGSRVYPRGVVIAGGGATTWAEKYTTVQNYFGVSAVASP